MQKMMISIVLVVVFVLAGMAQAAGPRGTADEAKAMVAKAVALYKSAGKDKAIAAFNDPKGAFVDRDLYVFIFDFAGNTLAHGANPKLIGKNLSNLQDAKGNYFIKEMINTAKTKGTGWVDYNWTNPISKQIEPKSSYIEVTGDGNFIGCGIYK